MTRDLTAGVTVAALLIPQGMAYAELAGLPAVNGLYAGFIPLLAYALLGSSRQLALGPTATVAVLTATVIEPFSGGRATEALALAHGPRSDCGYHRGSTLDSSGDSLRRALLVCPL